jgi:hypothetical protein
MIGTKDRGKTRWKTTEHTEHMERAGNIDVGYLRVFFVFRG